ncbi:MAG: capsule assembly Wzi family protein [Veillonellales bacterium]
MNLRVLSSTVALGLILAAVPAVYAQDNPGGGGASRVPYQDQLSGNVPLDSYVYDYLDKLDGLGYLRQMQTGTKPYTRMQVAGWVVQMDRLAAEKQEMAPYAKSLLRELKTEFKNELAVLNGTARPGGLALREIQFEENFYHGGTVSQKPWTKSAYQPLNVNNDGYKYGRNANEMLSLRLEGSLGEHLMLSVTPRTDYNSTDDSKTTVESGYIKTNINNLSIQIGKDANSWGQGVRSHLTYSNNAEPMTSIRLSNIEPMKIKHGYFKFLRESNTTFTYARMEGNRSDVPHPSFVAWRKDFTPSDNFTFALEHASIIGGLGHALSGSDYYRLLTGRNAGNCSSANTIDEWNTQAGGDFRWRLPHLNGIQVYGEFYGEDRHRYILYYPYRFAEIMGVYIPRLTRDGSWDATLEVHHTDPCWYMHGTYTDGWVFKGNIIGDAIGNHAKSYYAKVTHYQDNGSQLSFNLEQVKMEYESPASQKFNSAWANYRTKLEQDMFMDLTAGVSHIDNFNFLSGENKRNYKVGLGITKRY